MGFFSSQQSKGVNGLGSPRKLTPQYNRSSIIEPNPTHSILTLTIEPFSILSSHGDNEEEKRKPHKNKRRRD